MKSIWIYQPEASRIVDGEQGFINRGWDTNYRGTVSLYAGKLHPKESPVGHFHKPFYMHIGMADIIDSVDMRIPELAKELHGESLIDQILNNRYYTGPFCWILENIQKIKPVKSPVNLGLGNVATHRIQPL